MDFDTPVDDYCRAWHGPDVEVPETESGYEGNGDRFVITVYMENTYFPLEEEEEDDDKPDYLLDYDCDTSVRTFVEACRRVDRDNLPDERITSILCELGVPLNRQDSMKKIISDEADKIAKMVDNKNKKILSMIVSISLVAEKPIPENE